MISERLFARGYSSFWKDLLPFSEAFVRGINEEWDKVGKDISATSSIERAVVNEGAVRLYRDICNGARLASEVVIAAIREAAEWIGCTPMKIEDWCIEEAQMMATRLKTKYGKQDLVFSPSFLGCGVLSACQADILKGSTLIEVKSGHRSFRSPDFRQILTYAALNHSAPRYSIDSISLYNARLDRVVDMTLDELCLQLAGDSPMEIFARIIEFAAIGVESGT